MTYLLRRTRWLLPGTIAVLVLASAWGLTHVPSSNLLVHRIVSDTMSMPVPANRMKDRWTISLHLDPEAPAPGPRWVINDAANAGEGHEMRWQPDRLGLQLYRAADGFLLGSVQLTRMPHDLDLVRRGSWFHILVDSSEVMACLDPLATAGEAHAPGAWFSQTTSVPMDDASITIIDDGAEPQGELRRPRQDLTAVDRMHTLLEGVDGQQGAALESGLSAAGQAMQDLPMASELHRRLRHYLALAEARAALGGAENEGVVKASDAIEQLALLAAHDPIPESAGMLMSLLPRIASRACWRPSVPQPAGEVLAVRGLWLDVLGTAGTAASETCSPAVGDDLLYELHLLVHAAGCLQSPAGRPARSAAENGTWQVAPRPVPAEAPPWVAARWRAFAGGDPGGSGLPDPPAELRNGPVATAVEMLVRDAVLEPAAAVSMCFKMRRLIAAPEVVQALASPGTVRSEAVLAQTAQRAAALYEHGPAREAALCQALLAYRGIGSRESACQALITGGGGALPWAQRDPLAYALLSLLLHQDGTLIGEMPASLVSVDQADPLTLLVPEATLKHPQDIKELANFAPLLSGDASAPAQAWREWSAELPPAQELAAALAMQQALVAPGDHPDAVPWDLLGDVRCFTLPLEVLMPRQSPSAGPLATPEAATAIP